MRDYGRVPCSIWLDEYPSEDVRTLVLYVACGPHSNGIGCYRLPLAYIATDLGWTMERVEAALDLSTGKGLARATPSPSGGLLYYDDKASFVMWPRAFEASPVESPNGAKALVPFINGVPKCSPLLPILISMLTPFSSKFPKGYLEGLARATPSPTASPSVAEQVAAAAATAQDSFNLPPSEQEAARGDPVDNSGVELNLNDYRAASVVIAKMIHRRRLTPNDQHTLLGWCKAHDIESTILPWLDERVRNHLDKNGALPAHPLTYFHSGLNEHLAKIGLKK